jgi:hypothetical protein
VFGERLVDFFPSLILPISTLPVPRDTIHLFDSNYRQIQALLVPGKRQRDTALGLIRTLLAMESHVVEEVEVNVREKIKVIPTFPSLCDWRHISVMSASDASLGTSTRLYHVPPARPR